MPCLVVPRNIRGTGCGCLHHENCALVFSGLWEKKIIPHLSVCPHGRAFARAPHGMGVLGDQAGPLTLGRLALPPLKNFPSGWQA
jgi:hypothetical protein